MEISGLIEIALADTDEQRVEVVALEPAEISTKAVAGLAELVFELVNNAITFSDPWERVRVTGLFDQDSYLISISDSGVGVPEHLMEALNRMLEGLGTSEGDAGSMLGILIVARLASRHGISVRLVPGVPGTTARVTVPANLVTRVEGADGEPVVPAREDEVLPQGAAVRSPSESATDEPDESLVDVTYDFQASGDQADSPRERASRTHQAYLETEAFLERIFAPLWDEPPLSDLTVTQSSSSIGEVVAEEEPVEPVQRVGVPPLRVRVPGDNFVVTEDDPSTAAGEAAVDIRTALSRFEQGRRSAEQAADQD